MEITSPNTGDTLSTMSPEAVRKLWQKGVDIFEQNSDFFSEMEGPSPRHLVWTETDTSKGKGQSITFTVMSGFYGEGKQGDELFDSEEDFEDINIAAYPLVVDFIRNATRYTERTEEKMGMRGEIADGLPEELGKWMGRAKTHQMFMAMRHKAGEQNYLFAGGRGSVNELRSADTLDWDEVVAMGTAMKPLGGKPAYVGYQNKANNRKQGIFAQCVIGTEVGLFSLKLDSDYKKMLENAGTRGDTNYLFAGGYQAIDGHVIKEYVPIDHDGMGPIGSPLNPKAELGIAITAGNGALEITGGGSTAAANRTKFKYFRDFPNYAYRWHPADILDVSAPETFYVLIVNPPTGPDARKIGFYECQANNGNRITVTKRLRATTSAEGGNIAHDEIGGVKWNTGVWEGLHTDQHPAGAEVILCNSHGVPYGDTYMLGAAALRRGYGKWRNRRTTQEHEGGFVRDIFVTSVFGQELRRDRRLRVPGMLRLRHAIQYPGLPIPNTIT